MMERFMLPAVLLLGLMPLPAGFVFAQEKLYVPERNPFAPPAGARYRPAAAEQESSNEQKPWRPVVRAIIHGGPRSLVNLDGQIIGLGETVAGYMLVEVSDYEAVFVRDGKRVRLAIGMQQAS